ncbi:MAG: restriction endonuclease subunit S [Burkholderiales bacterium]|nr:restriction endonuclease subunit S [Burkholderiales bacterium]
MTTALPEGWDVVPIGSVARVVGGGTPPSHDPDNFALVGHGIPWVTPADLSGYRSQSISRGARDLSEAGLTRCGATLMPKGTVLFSSRAPIGYVAIAANAISTNQGFKSFVLPAGIDPRFVYWQLRHLKPEAEVIATGTTFKELSGAAAAKLPLRIAPAPEQTRIADQLDTLLARIQACQDRLEAIPALLKRFRRAVLDAAASGALIDENGPPAAVVKLGFVLAEPMRNGKSVRDGSGLKVLRLTALKQSGIDLTATKTGDWTGVRDVQRFLIRDGDYLVSRGNGSKELVGRGGKVANCSDDVAFPDTMIRIRPDTSRLLPDYLNAVWAAPVVRKQIEAAAKTTAGIWKVSQPDLEGVAIPLPSIERQATIVQRVQALMNIASEIERRHIASARQVLRLTPLTLAKAFRGELVPQDPTDEPAHALLARIATQRNVPTDTASATTPRRGRPPRTPKESATMTKSRQDHDVMDQPYLAGHLRRIGTPASAEALFKVAELPVADFYKQLAWEVTQGHVKDNQTTLEPGHAAG